MGGWDEGGGRVGVWFWLGQCTEGAVGVHWAFVRQGAERVGGWRGTLVCRAHPYAYCANTHTHTHTHTHTGRAFVSFSTTHTHTHTYTHTHTCSLSLPLSLLLFVASDTRARSHLRLWRLLSQVGAQGGLHSAVVGGVVAGQLQQHMGKRGEREPGEGLLNYQPKLNQAKVADTQAEALVASDDTWGERG